MIVLLLTIRKEFRNILISKNCLYLMQTAYFFIVTNDNKYVKFVKIY